MPQRDNKHPDLASRLNHILETMDWSKTDLAREAGCGPSAVTNWFSRNRGMEPQYAFALQDKHRWNARWILEGVGPARLQTIDSEDEALLQRIRELPPERRKALALILEGSS